MEQTIAEQIQSLGLGQWKSGATMSSTFKGLAVNLPKECAERFAKGSYMTASMTDGMFMVRVRPDLSGSCAHESKSHGRNVHDLIELTRGALLFSPRLPLFSRSCCEYALTPTEVVLRLHESNMSPLITRRRAKRRETPVSDYLTRDNAPATPSAAQLERLSNLAQGEAMKRVADWRDGVGANVSDAWARHSDPVERLKLAVRTINALQKDLPQVVLHIDADGQLVGSITQTFT